MRVLLIDDDALVRLMLLDTLAAEGIEVDGLANAEDALVLLGAGQVPDVLVADIDLGPGLSGLDLASIAQERHPMVQVVLISGTSPAPGVLGRRERFLRKPFAPAALAEAIRGAAVASAAAQPGEDPGTPSPDPGSPRDAVVPFAPLGRKIGIAGAERSWRKRARRARLPTPATRLGEAP